MKILIVGGAGFIGSHITAQLIKKHDIIIAARGTAEAKRRFPSAEICVCNFIVDTNVNIWLKRLQGIDAVINCVGVLNTLNSGAIYNIHYEAPKALFEACQQAGIHRVIHISAMGIEDSNVAYASSKRKLDEWLLQQQYPVTIFRPSFVYSHTSYGGSSLFRALAAFPLFIPMVGKGETVFQPIHAEDLTAMVAAVIDNPTLKPELLYAAGTERLNFKSLLQKLRGWLGLKPAPFIYFPFKILKLFAPIGNILSWIPINATTIGMMQEARFDIEEKLFEQATQRTKVQPRSISVGLQTSPSGTQDLWQARLYFLHPLLRIVLAFLWIWSGIVGLVMQTKSYLLLQYSGIPIDGYKICWLGSCIFDIILGVAVFSGQWRRVVNSLQFLAVLFYTLFVSFTLPSLWLEPFAPITKNLPVLICILFLMVLGRER